jgi:CheY-like chemotaxis protein
MLLSVLKTRQRLGYHVDTACGGWDALEQMRVGPPYSVIISDLEMPAMDGFDFLKRCRKQAPGTIRLMLSGSESDERIAEALADDLIFRFILKPITPHQLCLHLDDAVNEQRRLSDEAAAPAL